MKLRISNTPLVPSPLNGERDRVRGGHTHRPPQSRWVSLSTTASSVCPVPHFLDVVHAFANRPKWFRAQNECPSTASSKIDALQCSTSREGKSRASHLLHDVLETRAGFHPTPDCNELQRSKSRDSGLPVCAGDETYKQRNADHGGCATASFRPTWTSFAKVGRVEWTYLSLVGVRRVACKHGVHADAHLSDETSVHRVPSALNGEKVAEGRMRGGHTSGSDSCSFIGRDQLALPPLTLTLSPLRGEGTANWHARCNYTSFVEFHSKPFNSEQIFHASAVQNHF